MRFRGRTDILSGCALQFLKKRNRKFYRLPDPVLVAADLNQSSFGRVITRTNQIDLLSPFPPIWGIPSGPAKFNLGSFLSGVIVTFDEYRRKPRRAEKSALLTFDEYRRKGAEI